MTDESTSSLPESPRSMLAASRRMPLPCRPRTEDFRSPSVAGRAALPNRFHHRARTRALPSRQAASLHGGRYRSASARRPEGLTSHANVNPAMIPARDPAQVDMRTMPIPEGPGPPIPSKSMCASPPSACSRRTSRRRGLRLRPSGRGRDRPSPCRLHPGEASHRTAPRCSTRS